MAKKVKTVQQLGREIIAELERTHQIPSGLEYISASIGEDGTTPIYDVEFDIIGTIQHGSCEGFYADIYLDGYFGKDADVRKRVLLLSAKALLADRPSIEKMSLLAAACVFVGSEYVDAHKNELMRRGYRCKKTPDSEWSLIVSTKEAALEYKKKGCEVFDLFEQKPL